MANSISLLEFLQELEKVTGREAKVNFTYWRAGDQKVYIANARKAKQKLG